MTQNSEEIHNTNSQSSASNPWTPVSRALQRIDAADRGPKRNFIILGAGIAGIAAAYELQQRGHTVRILEGSKRAGGRIYTHRFKNGSHSERGAMRIPLAHDYTRHYIRAAGIPSKDLRRFLDANPRGQDYVDMFGTVSRSREFKPETVPVFERMSSQEQEAARKGGAGAVLSLYMTPLFERLQSDGLVAELIAGNFSHSLLKTWDSMSWRQYLTNKASVAGLEFLGRVLTLKPNWDWSLAAILRNELHQPGNVLYEIAGGTERLITGMLERLQPGTVDFGRRAVDIVPSRTGGTIRMKDGKDEPFERLLCTVPFPVLRRMPLNGFSKSKRGAIDGIRYMSASKVYFAYDVRWWEQDGIVGGRSVSDRPAGTAGLPRQVYYPSDTANIPLPDALRAPSTADLSSGLFNEYMSLPDSSLDLGAAVKRDANRPGSILASYTFDEASRALCRLPPEQRVQVVIDSLKPMHGDLPARPVDADPWCWDEHPWTRGALAITPPTDLTRFLADARKPEGRIHFAGEHVSIAPGWIQGSLESSLREVASMLEKT